MVNAELLLEPVDGLDSFWSRHYIYWCVSYVYLLDFANKSRAACFDRVKKVHIYFNDLKHSTFLG